MSEIAPTPDHTYTAKTRGASAAKVSSSSPDCVVMPFLLPNSKVSNHSPLLVRAFFTPVLGSTAHDLLSVVSVPFFGSKLHAFTQGRAVCIFSPAWVYTALELE